MLKINDLPLKSINTSGFNGNVVVTLSSPYFISPSTIQVDILQITNKSSIQSMSWSVMPAYEEVLPELIVTQNSVSFEEAYYFGGMVLQLSVLLKNGQYQYYYVPVDLEGIPPFEAACEHCCGDFLSFYTSAPTVRLVVNGVNLGDISLTAAGYGDIIYQNDSIVITYSEITNDFEYIHWLYITSNSPSSDYTPNTIEFFPMVDSSYSIFTSLSNFPMTTEEVNPYVYDVDLSNLGYDATNYFIAANCCFQYIDPAQPE